MTIEFTHAILSESYEEQANKQGFTFGDNADYVQDMGGSLIDLYHQKCISDKEFDRILQKFQKKILANKRFLQKLNTKAVENEIIPCTQLES